MNAARRDEVHKGVADVYTVRTANGEWGTVFVDGWTAPPVAGETEPRYGGHFSAVTTFGQYGATWTHCGMPFKQFLVGLERDYFMSKAAPQGKYREFDRQATLEGLRAALFEARRHTDIDRADARAIFDGLRALDDGDGGPSDLVRSLYDIRELRRLTQEPYEFLRERMDPQAEGFWRHLWPLLLGQWRTEVTPVAMPLATAAA